MGSPVDDALDRLERCIDWREGRGRERAAEALATVREELQRLREERDVAIHSAMAYRREREAAEAEQRRLREGLREIAEQAKKGIMSENRLPFLTHIGVIAETTLASDPERHVRALLAAPAGEHTEGEGGEA